MFSDRVIAPRRAMGDIAEIRQAGTRMRRRLDGHPAVGLTSSGAMNPRRGVDNALKEADRSAPARPQRHPGQDHRQPGDNVTSLLGWPAGAGASACAVVVLFFLRIGRRR
jgi:hypothetical protein